MGNGKTKPKQAQHATREGKPKTKKGKVCLLVLHKNGQQPGTGNLVDALNTYPPPGSIEVSHEKTSPIPDDGRLPNSVRNTIQTWIRNGYIVLICLLTDCDLGDLNQNKVIVFHGKDFYTAGPGEMKNKLDDVAAQIHAASH